MHQLLLDEGVSLYAAQSLAALGMPVSHVGNEGAPSFGSSDDDNCAWCAERDAVLVTNDRGRKDKAIHVAIRRHGIGVIFVHNDLRGPGEAPRKGSAFGGSGYRGSSGAHHTHEPSTPVQREARAARRLDHAWEHAFVSIKGSPYANFSRALETRKLSVVLMAAAELQSIQLDDARDPDPHGR